MADDELSVLDLERVLLTGDIIQRQRDQKGGEWKYLVRGKPTGGVDVVVVTRCYRQDGGHHSFSGVGP